MYAGTTRLRGSTSSLRCRQVEQRSPALVPRPIPVSHAAPNQIRAQLLACPLALGGALDGGAMLVGQRATLTPGEALVKPLFVDAEFGRNARSFLRRHLLHGDKSSAILGAVKQTTRGGAWSRG